MLYFIEKYIVASGIFYLCRTVKKLTILLAFFFALNAYSQIERDKALHFLGGNLFGLAGAGIAKQISDGNRFWTFAGAVGGATLIGLGKEAVDASQREGGWDNDDLLATVLGGVTVGVTIDLFTNHKRDKKLKSTAVSQNWRLKAQPVEIVLSNANTLLPSMTRLGLSEHLMISLE